MRRIAIGSVVLAAIGVLGGCGREPAVGTAPNSPVVTDTAPKASAGSAPAPVRPTVRTISITVRGGQATGETGRVAVALGTPVTVFVTSDIADEIHVRGYDRKAAVAAGGTGLISFTANAPGVFEVELAGSKLQLVALQVS
ncbi:MAG: hypothetical protein ACRDTJ_12865 [Pseudonocardiaceae bacterium]